MRERLLSDENQYLQIFANASTESVKRFRIDGMPEFGHLSLMPLNVRVYDNPMLAHHLGQTACVINETGEVYIYAPFLKDIAEEDQANEGTPEESTNVTFVYLHELSHQYLGHIHQMPNLMSQGLSASSLNKAMDTSINTMILKYPKIKLGTRFKSVFDKDELVVISGFYGTSEEEAKVFKNASFVEIAWHYNKKEQEELEKRKNQPQNGQPQNGQPQNGQPQSGQPQNGQPQNGQPQSGQPQNGQPQNGQPQSGQPQNGQPQNGQPQSGQPQNGKPQNGQPQSGGMSNGGDFGLDHTKSLKDLVDALNNSGLGHVVDHFKYPKDVTPEIAEQYAKRQENLMNRIDSQMSEIMQRAKKSGDPAADFFSREHKASKPKQVGLENLNSALANCLGGDFQHIEFEPGLTEMLDSHTTREIYGVDQMPMAGIYAPLSEEQTMLIVVDSSGSMLYQDRLGQALAAVVGVVDSNPALTGIYLSFADDVSRKIQFYSRDEITSLKSFKVSGFGGTDMAQSLVSSIMMARRESESIKAVIMIHDGDDYDLGDRMSEVQEASLQLTGDYLPPLVCIIPEGCGAAAFRESMSDYAVILEMSENKHSYTADMQDAESKRTASIGSASPKI